MWMKNKEPVIQNGRHMHRPKLTQALPVSPVYSVPTSPSLPPPGAAAAQPATSLWYDHSESAVGQRSANNA